MGGQTHPRRQQVGVDIAGEKQYLEHEHACGPYGRCSTEPGQDVFGDYELYLEEEESSEENGDGIRQRTLEPQPSTHRHGWRIRRNWAVGLKSGSLQNLSHRLI